MHHAVPKPNSLLWNLQVVGFLLLFVTFPLTLVARAQTKNSGHFRGAGLLRRVIATGSEDKMSNSRPASANSPIFRPAVEFSIGAGAAMSVAVADLNGDAKPDLVAVTQNGGNNGHGSVAVLLGDGDGSFTLMATYDSGDFGGWSVAATDLNDDAKVDIVVAKDSLNK